MFLAINCVCQSIVKRRDEKNHPAVQATKGFAVLDLSIGAQHRDCPTRYMHGSDDADFKATEEILN